MGHKRGSMFVKNLFTFFVRIFLLKDVIKKIVDRFISEITRKDDDDTDKQSKFRSVATVGTHLISKVNAIEQRTVSSVYACYHKFKESRFHIQVELFVVVKES